MAKKIINMQPMTKNSTSVSCNHPQINWPSLINGRPCNKTNGKGYKVQEMHPRECWSNTKWDQSNPNEVVSGLQTSILSFMQLELVTMALTSSGQYTKHGITTKRSWGHEPPKHFLEQWILWQPQWYDRWLTTILFWKHLD